MNLFDASRHAAIAVDVLDPVNGHVAVPLTRLQGATLLWLNAEEAEADPAWARLNGDRAAYVAHLLAACAYKVSAEGETSDRTGIADRYGGGGIGTNGGSGRAAIIGPYCVKGVGRTPLIGRDVDVGHASGGAYLEECVRESVLAEILHRELPCGAVRTLAIIATGTVQVWQTDRGPKPERCCLLVRRAFLRPAHLERAPFYRGPEALPGLADAHRVRCTIAALERHAGGTGPLQEQLTAGFARWSRQLAATYLLCLPHGGVSSSNVTLDGRLLDFGATAAVPSLARYWVASGHHPSGEEFRDIVDTVNGVACAFRFTAGHGEPARAWRARTCDQVLRAYGEGLHAALLRLLGFAAIDAQALLKGPAGPALARELDLWLRPLRHQAWSIFEGTPWQTHAMPAATALDKLEADLLRIASDAGAAMPDGLDASVAARRAIRARWTAPRIRLDRERLKEACYARFDGRYPSAADLPALREAIAAFIDEVVAEEIHIQLTDPELTCA
ncbi:MAG: protein adenylyltransferase SelO family protein [Lysobacteraceae bacterium]